MIDLFFTLFNTALFMGLMVYGIRTYALPLIAENIRKEHDQLAQLHEEHKRLAMLQNDLEESISQQELVAKTLFKKINQWRNVVDVAARTQHELEERLRAEADAKVAYQNEQHSLNKVYHEIAPFVVGQLKQDLAQRYRDSEEGHEYIKRVLTDIKS